MAWDYDSNQTPESIAALEDLRKRQLAYTKANSMSREDFIKKYGKTFVADDKGGNAASEVAGQDVGAYYDTYLADGATGDGSGFGYKYRDANPLFDAWDNVKPHPESQDLGGVGEFWRQIGRPAATAAGMYFGVDALNGLLGSSGAGFSGVSGTGGSAGIGSGTALGGAELAGAAGAGDIAALSGSQIAALSPAATGSGFSFAVPEAMNSAVGLDLGGVATTAIPGESAISAAGLLGNESAAETARLASMNAGTNTLGNISPGSTIGSSSMFDTAGQWLKDNPTLAKLGGGLIGAIGGAAASGDKTTSASSSRDPWAPAQPYLIDNLKTNANAQEFYRANPFSDLQKQQYQGLFNSLANSQANIPGLLANASNFGKSSRGRMPEMQGLLSGTQAAPIDWGQYANIGRRG